MNIFVTGGSGFIGSAVIAELIRRGHQVTALARSVESAKKLEAAGAKVHLGNLKDEESLRSGAEPSDGVIHCGFIHDFKNYKENCEIDRRAIETLGAALARGIRPARPLVVTSGMGLISSRREATEDDMPPPSSKSPRAASEEATRDVSEKYSIPVAVVRLPPSVHGMGDHGFVSILAEIAGKKGMSAYVGTGSNRWCAVHRLDAAKLFCLVFEKLVRSNDEQKISIYHGVAEPEILFSSIATAIGGCLNVPVKSITVEEATENFTWFAHFVQMDAAGTSDKTKSELGWQPAEASLLVDISCSGYFRK